VHYLFNLSHNLKLKVQNKKNSKLACMFIIVQTSKCYRIYIKIYITLNIGFNVLKSSCRREHCDVFSRDLSVVKEYESC
jgi:hypothetical protein